MSEWLKVSMRHGSPTRMSPKVEGVLRLPRDSPWPCPHRKTEGQAARDEGDYSAGCRGPGNQESAEKARRGQGWHSPGNRTAHCQVPATGEPEGPGPGIDASGPTPRPVGGHKHPWRVGTRRGARAGSPTITVPPLPALPPPSPASRGSHCR